jgi:hypothetical protein
VKQDGAVVYEGLANSYVATVGYNTVTTFTVTYHLSLDGQTTNLGVGYKYTNGAPPAPAAPDPASLAQISIPTPTLVSRTENSLTVAWGQPSYTGVLQPGFTIRAFDPSGRSVAATSTNGRTATLGGLQPGVLYAVNVYADVVSQDGRKRVTGLSVLCVNTVAAPPAPVPAAPAPAVAPATAPATAPAAPATSTTAATSASASRAVTIAPTRAEDAQATASRLHPALAYLAQQEAAAPASAVHAVTSSTSLLDPGVLYFAGLQESTQPAAGTWIPLLNPGLAYFLQP